MCSELLIDIMKVYKILPDGFAANTYAVTENGKDCILIDCAQPRAFDECQKLALTVRAVLLTHGHYDHIGGCGRAYAAGVPVYCGENEDKLIFSDGNRAIFHGIEIPYFKIEKTLKDGEKLNLCGLDVAVISTPGHTSGGVCYVVGNDLFSGDTLFAGSVGRSDFATGDYRQLISSVRKLYALDGDYTVYCGHGEDTRLSFERAYNPFVRG